MAVVQVADRAGQPHAAEEGASTSAPDQAQQQQQRGSRRAARDTGMQLAAASPAEVREKREEYQAGKRRALEKVASEKQKRRWFGAHFILHAPSCSRSCVRLCRATSSHNACAALAALMDISTLVPRLHKQIPKGCIRKIMCLLFSQDCIWRPHMHDGNWGSFPAHTALHVHGARLEVRPHQPPFTHACET